MKKPLEWELKDDRSRHVYLRKSSSLLDREVVVGVVSDDDADLSLEVGVHHPRDNVHPPQSMPWHENNDYTPADRSLPVQFPT